VSIKRGYGTQREMTDGGGGVKKADEILINLLLTRYKLKRKDSHT